jgi:hypothetical protein
MVEMKGIEPSTELCKSPVIPFHHTPKGELMTYPCKQCNQLFEARLADRKRGLALFCSRDCFGLSKRGPRVSHASNCLCAFCGTPFFRVPSKMGNSKHRVYFCSRKCKDSGQRLGGIKEIMPAHYGRGSGQYTYREKIAIEKCARCGFNDARALVVHHKDRNRLNNVIGNLECLCCNCHSVEHKKWPA